jgi:hypothetical protein
MYQLNFIHYDDDQLPYVYAHTKRPMLAMLDQIDRIGQKNGTGEDTGIAIVSPDYWPLPWYFRNYTTAKDWVLVLQDRAQQPNQSEALAGSAVEERNSKPLMVIAALRDMLKARIRKDGSVSGAVRELIWFLCCCGET